MATSAGRVPRPGDHTHARPRRRGAHSAHRHRDAPRHPTDPHRRRTQLTEAAVTVDPVRDDALSVTVAGEIDMSNAPTVERQILDAIPNHLAEVSVDLSAL